MKMTPLVRSILVFMASSKGRFARIATGAFILSSAISQGGWIWLLAPLGAFMVYSGMANVCPLGPLFKQPFRSPELLAKLQKYDLK